MTEDRRNDRNNETRRRMRAAYFEQGYCVKLSDLSCELLNIQLARVGNIYIYAIHNEIERENSRKCETIPSLFYFEPFATRK